MNEDAVTLVRASDGRGRRLTLSQPVETWPWRLVLRSLERCEHLEILQRGIMPAIDISTSKRKYKTLGALAKGMRIKKRLTQREVAEYCKLLVGDIRRIENNDYHANYCYVYIFALGQMRSRRAKRTPGGVQRAGRSVRRRRKQR